MASKSLIYGLMAEFNDPNELVAAAHSARHEGYRRMDAYSPLPIEELHEALGFPQTKLPLIVLIGGVVGCVSGYLLQFWVSTMAYPMNVGGKPLHSWPAFIPVTFEVAVLFGALGAVFGMFGLNRLPMHHHPLFRSKVFERVTDDAFFISIESWDPQFDSVATGKLLKSLGAQSVELLES